MMQKDKIQLLKNEALTDDHTKGIEAVYSLIELDPAAVDYLIFLLDNENPIIRDRVALGLEKLGNNKALEPLFKAINKPENVNNRGTLVFALTALDCSHKLKQIFDLLFYGNAHVKMNASLILNKQEFEFTREELLFINDKWEALNANPSLSPYYDKYKDEIEHFVDGYLAYLKD